MKHWYLSAPPTIPAWPAFVPVTASRPKMARRRLDAQTPIETLRAAATHEVVNDGTAEQLAEKMHAVLQQL